MAEEQIQSEDAFSLFAVATILLNGRWRIARWMLAGGLLAAVGVVNKKAVYSASGSFLPQGFNSPRPSLTGLAGQLAGSITGVSQSMPPDFYVRLLKSRVLLQPIARDTFTVPELGGRRLSFDELFGITGGSQISRDEAAVSKLTGIISVSVVRSTGIIEFGVAAPWRSVALGIANDLVTGVNAYNQRTTQAQAAAEREFVEAQSALASSELQSAESRLERFLQTNRQFESSPELVFERDRLARDVTLKQQMYTSLMTALDDARLREVRNTPVITVFEPPEVPTTPEPRGRVRSVVMGLLLGGLVGIFLTFISGALKPDGGRKNSEAEAFFATLQEITSNTVGRVRRSMLRRP